MSELINQEVVYVTKGLGSTILPYTKERFEKFKENLTASGWRLATEKELAKKFNVAAVEEKKSIDQNDATVDSVGTATVVKVENTDLEDAANDANEDLGKTKGKVKVV